MSTQQNNPHSLKARLLTTSAIGLALWRWQPGPDADPVILGFWYIGLFFVVGGALGTLPDIARAIAERSKFRRAFGWDDSRGSSRFLTERELRKRRLHRYQKGSRFIGIVGRTPLWLITPTSHLILGPSGSQKTSAAIANILMGCSESALITDIKGELWETTRAHREREFKHRCVKIDPNDVENSVKINPLDPASAFIEAGNPKAFTYVRGMALQLYPDPAGGGGANDVFYKGGRGLIVTTIFAVIEVLPAAHRNLAMVYRALSDLDILHDLLEAASKSPAMNGEIASMAYSVHRMAFGDSGNSKNFESFRINALQAIEAFGPGNYLAPLTSETTFTFSELKAKPTSLYVMIDFANSDVLGQFSGLLQWMAADALVEAGNDIPVLFVLDEFCNSPMHTLPKILTLLRSAGVRVIMATQDLDDITRVYSKHALETVLSESYIKQWLGGIKSKSTLEYLSSYLGEYSELSSSYSLGDEETQESVSRINRRLLDESELRTMPEDAQLIIYGSEKPILAKKVQVFAIAPWRELLGINSIYGSERMLLPVEVRQRRRGWKVTRRGARLYREMARQVLRPDKGKERLRGSFLSQLIPSPALILAAALFVAAYFGGLPNLRFEYGYRGSARQTPVSYVWCQYIGPTSPGRISGPDCPLIVWRKVW